MAESMAWPEAACLCQRVRCQRRSHCPKAFLHACQAPLESGKLSAPGTQRSSENESAAAAAKSGSATTLSIALLPNYVET